MIREVKVEKYLNKKTKDEEYIVYKLRVNDSVLDKRFTDFYNLDRELRQLDSKLIKIPGKSIFKNEKVLNDRVTGFNNYLNFIISSKNPVWRDSKQFRDFIRVENDVMNWNDQQLELTNKIKKLKSIIYKRDNNFNKLLIECLTMMKALQSRINEKIKNPNELNKRKDLLMKNSDEIDIIQLMIKDNLSSTKISPVKPTTKVQSFGSKNNAELKELQVQEIANQDKQLESLSNKLHLQLNIALTINQEIEEQNEFLSTATSTLKTKNCTSITPNYDHLYNNLQTVKSILGSSTKLTLAEKILYSHLTNPEDSLSGYNSNNIRGNAYLKLTPDRVAMQDASAQMALLQFMTCGLETTAIPSSIHCDHLIQAYEGAESDLKRSIVSNKEVFDFLESASKKYGIEFWKPGAGIIHQLVLENYAAPGMLMLGTDSHTPNAGGMGMLAIGVGGADAVDGMSGTPWELKAPKVIGVKLTGQMNGWTTPKDLILHLAGKLTVKGGTGSIIEYFGPGLDNQSCTGLATMANMGAEVGATTSTFPYSNSMREYLHATARGPVAKAADEISKTGFLQADKDAEYDQVIEINLSELEPHINGPFTPDLATPLSKFKQMVQENNWPTKLSAGLIGSCTNSSYQDMSRVESIAQQAKAANREAVVPFMVTPGSELIRATIERDGVQSTLESVGATVLANACGPCIGQWDRREAKNEDNAILTSFNRNFKARNDGNLKTMNFLASPEIVTAMSIAGSMTFNPMTDILPASGNSKELKFEPPHGTFLPTEGFIPGDTTFAPEPTPEPIPETPVQISPSSTRLEILEPFKSHFENPEEAGELPKMQCLMRVRGKCTTDHISAAGPWLKYKGHLSNISENTLMTAVNDEDGKVNSAYDFQEKTTSTIPDIAKRYRERQQPWMIVVDENYGEGSAREHAAMQPRWLGCCVVLGRSLARIHETNIKKQGFVPLTFKNKEDYNKIDAGDQVETVGLKGLFAGDLNTPVSVKVTKKDGSVLDIPVNHTLSVDQLNWVRHGSALNAIAAAAAAK
ncbi:aconitate hydratase [Wallemia mellicola]|uniref:Aconitate hydratase n=2 Tax=Wallemia mellicola TaxID=1708541 RepID=A0A4T0LXJ3_9BASI|nr:aconitate hydratase [Wallemia mellicola]